MTEHEQENINAFLRDELTQTKRQEFINSLANNAELAQELELQKRLYDSLGAQSWSSSTSDNLEFKALAAIAKSEQIKQLKQVLETTSLSHKSSSGWSILKNWRVLSAAAVVLAIVGIFSILDTGPNYQELFYEYQQKSSISSTIERGDNNDSIALEIELAYRNKAFARVLELSNVFVLKNTKNASVYLFLGDSYTQLDRFDEALITYDSLIKSDLLDSPKGYWFKALTYLKMKDLTNTKATLEYIVANKLYNDALAAELLRKI
jgi:tetratricopeptide (TPR) repeat protein